MASWKTYPGRVASREQAVPLFPLDTKVSRELADSEHDNLKTSSGKVKCVMLATPSKGSGVSRW